MPDDQRDPAHDAEAPHYTRTVNRALLVVYCALATLALAVILGATYLVVASRW